MPAYHGYKFTYFLSNSHHYQDDLRFLWLVFAAFMGIHWSACGDSLKRIWGFTEANMGIHWGECGNLPNRSFASTSCPKVRHRSREPSTEPRRTFGRTTTSVRPFSTTKWTVQYKQRTPPVKSKPYIRYYDATTCGWLKKNLGCFYKERNWLTPSWRFKNPFKSFKSLIIFYFLGRLRLEMYFKIET